MTEQGTVTMSRNGATYHGNYFVKQRMVHLVSNIGNKCTQVGDTPAVTLAEMMLRELVQAREAKIARGP